ncbi:hypothetical protein [Vibrio sp. McD22-P3]|uniref:hypothetical protein n=1 Tax=Vibrio sp. McD22-P3 TaxID=2724880 RepID=UPI001F3945FA|nr:hypothetical protein [Vibrio sp. McD22-P3]MCF4176350.1 hypothetical protein [Vibrio sp. McD22-P3]
MSVRDKLLKPKSTESAPEPTKLPTWVTEGSDTTQTLYHAAQQEYKHICGLIVSGKAESPKDRRLVPAKIAARAKLDRSNINPRRQFELCQWIEDKNGDLAVLFDLHKPARQPAKSQSKRELQREITRLRNGTKVQTDAERRAIVEAFFSSNMLDDRSKLNRENSRLKLENEQLNDQVARLQQTGRENDRLIARLMGILTPEQRAQLQDISLVPKAGGPQDV